MNELTPKESRLEKFKKNIREKRIQKHVQENRSTYIVGAAGVVSVVGALVFKTRPIIINTVAPVFNNLPVFNNTVNNGGRCFKVVQDMATGDIWEKAKILAAEIAIENGITFESARTMLSKNLNGHLDNVYGKQYRTIALGTG